MFGFFGFLLGTVLGSFTLVLADRSLTKKSFWGRSYCLWCKKTLKWYDLFPVLSYIFLSGRCRYCKKKIGNGYPGVEIMTGILIGFLFWQSFQGVSLATFSPILIIFLAELILKVFFITILVAVFITDFRKMLIPDRIMLPSLLIGFILKLLLTIFKIGYLYFFLSQNIVGKYLLPPRSDYFLRHAYMSLEPLLLSLLMALLFGGFFYLLIVITKGKGMGGGDVKLGAFIGLMMGFPEGLLALLLSFLTGAIFSIFLIIFGKKHFGQSIPFGPFLVLGSIIALFWGQEIINWYIVLSFSK